MSALRKPPFRRLVIAWTFSNFGDSALYLTVAIWAKDLTGSNAAAGLVFLALGLPVFLAPFAGHVADRVSRRRLVVVVNLVAAAGVLSLLVVESAAQIWIVYAVTFGYGCVGYLTSAAQSGLLKDMLDDDELGGANGLLSSIDQGLRLLTPLVGAGIYALYGGGTVAILTSSVLVVAALVMLTVRMTETPPASGEDREGYMRELTAGLRHIRSVPVLAQLIVLVGIAFAVTGLANSTTFALIDEGLGMDSEFFGVLASIQGGGAIVGGLTAALVSRRFGERHTVGAGLACVMAGMATGLTREVTVVCAGFMVLGLGVVWLVVGLVTLRQRLTPPRLQGRTSSAMVMALNGPQTAGTAAGAALIAVVDYRILITVMVGTILACAIMLLARPAPRVGPRGPSLAHLSVEPASVRTLSPAEVESIESSSSVPHTDGGGSFAREHQGDSTPVAVKIKLKRMGKVRSPHYRIIVADARNKRDGRAIEEIGLYNPMVEPSLIQVDSERAQYWLGVGAQPTEPVLSILKVTGDWQTAKGLSGGEGTLKVAEPKAEKRAAFDAALAEVHGESNTAATTPKKKTAKKSTPKAEESKAEEPKAEEPKADESKAETEAPAAEASADES